MATDEYALVTRDTVNSYRIANGEQLNATPETNILIDNLINTVSSRFESYCDREFLSREHTEYSDGENLSIMYPKQSPITAVSSINDDSTWTWDSSTVISGANYRIANTNSIVFSSTAYALGNYRQNVKLVYTAGYTTIPYDLETACVNEVLRAITRLKELSISEKRSQDYLIKYVMTPFLPDTKLILDKYQRKGAF